jgi:4-hydroxy-3-methylbut-2-enyl diphosphate reductase
MKCGVSKGAALAREKTGKGKRPPLPRRGGLGYRRDRTDAKGRAAVKIRVAKRAGFCSGVRRAVDLAMRNADKGGAPLVTCGPLVHNPRVADLLAARGVGEEADAAAIVGARVLVRSHGLPPADEALLRARNPVVLDATCRRVRRVQEAVAEHAARGFTVLIAGEPEHPEVRGLLGYAAGRGIVLSSPEDAQGIPAGTGPLVLVAQTTQDEQDFAAVAAAVRSRFPGKPLAVIDTICDATRRRREEAVTLAAGVDRMIVVGGRTSGNTRRLAQAIARAGTPCDLVEDETEIDPARYAGVAKVGVTAGASTPSWVVQRVVERLRGI